MITVGDELNVVLKEVKLPDDESRLQTKRDTEPSDRHVEW